MKEKLEAIFDLREAAENHARAQVALELHDTPGRRDALLEARLHLEETTQEAVESCEHCGQPHPEAADRCKVLQFRAKGAREN